MVATKSPDAVQRPGIHLDEAELRKRRCGLVQRGVKRRTGKGTRESENDTLRSAPLRQVVMDEGDWKAQAGSVTSTKGWHDQRVSGILRLREKDLEWREVEGEVVALDLRTSRYLAVNRTGARLWSSLAKGATHEQLTETLVQSYGISSEQADAETNEFVDMLRVEGLLDAE
jgi:hypothetical protein